MAAAENKFKIQTKSSDIHKIDTLPIDFTS